MCSTCFFTILAKVITWLYCTVMNLHDLLNSVISTACESHVRTPLLLLQSLSHSASRACHNTFLEVLSTPETVILVNESHKSLALLWNDEGHMPPHRSMLVTEVPGFTYTVKFSFSEADAPLLKYVALSHWGSQMSFRHSSALYRSKSTMDNKRVWLHGFGMKKKLRAESSLKGFTLQFLNILYHNSFLAAAQ